MKRVYYIISSLFLLTLVARLFLSATITISSDSVVYIHLAQQISHGKFFVDNFKFPGDIYFPQPLFSIVLVAINTLINNWEVSGIIINLLFGSLLIIPVYFLSKNLFGQPIAIISSILVALQPILISMSGRVLTESLFIFLWLSIIYLVYRFRYESRRFSPFLLIGLVIGLAYLTKIVGLVALPIALAFVFFGQKMRKRKLITIFLVIGGAVLIMMPYILILHAKTGTWALSGEQNLALNILSYARDNKDSNFYALSRQLTDGGVYKVDTLKATGHFSFASFIRFLEPLPLNILIYLIVLLLMIPGVLLLLALFSSRKDEQVASGVIFLIPWFAVYILFYATVLIERSLSVVYPLQRYAASVIPLVLILVGLAVHRTAQQLARLQIIKSVTVTSAVIVVIIVLSYYPAASLANIGWLGLFSHNYEKEVGQWVGANIPAGAKLLLPVASLGFYSNRPYYVTPNTDYQTLLAYIEKNAISYILVDSWYLGTNPALRPLFYCNTDCSAFRAVKVHSFSMPAISRQIELYKIL